jgi:DNA-binding XRE family transcriptional regulator
MSGPRFKTLGDVVKLLRQRYGIGRDALNAAVGLPFGTVKRIEQGRYWPPWETLDKLCAHPSMRRLIEVCVREGVDLGARPPAKA